MRRLQERKSVNHKDESMQEKWNRWQPHADISGKYAVTALQMTDEGLTIKLSPENNDKNIEIRFEHTIDAYRYTNDSFCFKICSDLSETYGADFYGEWSFFTIPDSEYLRWLSEKSGTYANEFPFIHFCIIGSDEIVEILARYEPTVVIL